MARDIFLPLDVNYAEDLRCLSRFGRDTRALRDLFVAMMAYCKRNLSDGFVPSEEIGVLVYPDSPRIGTRDVARLVEVGLVEVAAGGFFVPAFLKRNKTKAQVEEVSAARADAGRRGGVRSGEVRRVQAGGKQVASGTAKRFASSHLNTENIGQRTQTPPYPPTPADPPPDPGDLAPGYEQPAELIAQVRAVRPDWSVRTIARALADQSVRDRPWPVTRAALLAVAADPATNSPMRLTYDGPWWRPLHPVRDPVPDWCGHCDNPATRYLDDGGDGPVYRCPDCHPAASARPRAREVS